MSSARLKWHTSKLGTLRGQFQKILRKPHTSECYLHPGREDWRGDGGYGASPQIITPLNMEESHFLVILPCTEEAPKIAVV